MKKRDFILIGAILAVALLALVVVELINVEGSYVTVKVNGQLVAQYNLSEDGEYVLNDGTNILKIEDGKVWMEWADCPARGATRCTHQGKKSKSLEWIYCKDNKVFVEVHGPNKADAENEVELELG